MELLTHTVSYQLGKPIAAGGTGVIYTAAKLDDQGKPDGLRYVAKEINKKLEALADREKMFSQKVEDACAYSIAIPILDEISTGEKEYLIMQLRHQGMFLSELLDVIRRGEERSGDLTCPALEGPISFRHMKGILTAVLISLGRMHRCIQDGGGQKGFLHLDLHPGNIFLENVDLENGIYGTVKFIDFQNMTETDTNGFAQIKEENYQIGVTVGFSAPELLEGKLGSLSIGSDLYSVAAIGMHMLTGKYMDGRFYSYYDFLEEIEPCFQKSGLVPVAYGYLRQFLRVGLDYHAAYRFASAKEMLSCLEQIDKLQEFYQQEDYFSLFRQAFHMGIAGEQMKEGQIRVSKEGFQKAVKKLKMALLADSICVLENQFVFEQLENLYCNMPQKPQPSVGGSLFSSGLAIYNHLADNKKCLEMYGKLLELREGLHIIEDWPTVRNRAAVSYADTFQAKEALQILEENIRALEKVKESYLLAASDAGISAKEASALTDLGRAYSSYGTCLAYLGQGDPMEYFQKALEEFASDKGNCAITISHILHYAMEPCQSADEKKLSNQDAKADGYRLFDQWYRRLTGGPLEERDEIKVFMEAEWKNGFNLWLYLKAVYLFDRQDKIPGLAEKIIALMDTQGLYSRNQHPEALILKYCGLLLDRLDSEKYGEYAYQAFETALRRLEFHSRKEIGGLTLFKIFAYHIQSEKLIVMGRGEEANSLYQSFLDRLKDSVYFRLGSWLEEYNEGREIPRIALKGEYC